MYKRQAYYQLNQKWDKELRKGVFVSTGGAPSQQQFKAMLEATPHAYHHLCLDVYKRQIFILSVFHQSIKSNVIIGIFFL